MSDPAEQKPKGPYTVWVNYGYDGWSFQDYEALKDAVEAEKHATDWVITRGPLDYTIVAQDKQEPEQSHE